jgi:Fe-S-cluster containining protein
VNCLHCGDCCKRMCPLTGGDPCPHLVEKEGYTFCGIYEDRPKQCQDHKFHSRFCPIGMMTLKPQSLDEVRERINHGWKLCKELRDGT